MLEPWRCPQRRAGNLSPRNVSQDHMGHGFGCWLIRRERHLGQDVDPLVVGELAQMPPIGETSLNQPKTLLRRIETRVRGIGRQEPLVSSSMHQSPGNDDGA